MKLRIYKVPSDHLNYSHTGILKLFLFRWRKRFILLLKIWRQKWHRLRRRVWQYLEFSTAKRIWVLAIKPDERAAFSSLIAPGRILGMNWAFEAWHKIPMDDVTSGIWGHGHKCYLATIWTDLWNPVSDILDPLMCLHPLSRFSSVLS